ncbi:hypothetical protein PMAYCL1PPCAC_13202, partial [Pristionchus mayeri]
AERTVESVVDEYLNAANAFYEQSESTDIPCAEEGNNRNGIDELTAEVSTVVSSVPVSIGGWSGGNEMETHENMTTENNTLVVKPSNANQECRVVISSESSIHAIREMFNEIDSVLNDGSLQANKTSYLVNQDVLHKMLQGADERKLFFGLIKERLSNWVTTDTGMSLLAKFAENRSTRPLLSVLIPSVLLRLSEKWREVILGLMLSLLTHEEFVNKCLEGGVSSSFAKIFRSELATDECVKIGMKLAWAKSRTVHEFLVHFGRSITKTAKGRLFIERLTKPPPEGLEWTDFIKFLPLVPNFQVTVTEKERETRKRIVEKLAEVPFETAAEKPIEEVNPLTSPTPSSAVTSLPIQSTAVSGDEETPALPS